MASGKTLFNARSMSPFCISPRDGDMDVAQFSFATPLMRHRQLGRGSRIFCGVWGNRSCVVDSAGAWSLRCLAHLMTSTQAAMACPSSFATRISDTLVLAFRMPSLRNFSAVCAEQSTFEPRRLPASPHRRCPRARCTIRGVSPVPLPNPKRSNLDTTKRLTREPNN